MIHLIPGLTKSSRLLHRCLLLGFGSLLMACQGIDLESGFTRDSVLHARIIDQQEDRFAHIDPLFINAEIKAMVDDYVDGGDAEELIVRKLQDLLYSDQYLNMQYSDEETHTAIEVFQAREGNCLSVMNLFVAMARYAGVDANFQSVRVQPHWDRRGDLLVLSEHINATGRFGVQTHYVVDFTPEIALQQLTANVVSDQHARALYFNNLGVEALVAGDMQQALVYFKNALFLDEQLAMSWNNIGAVYNRLDEPELAEYSYKMAFNSDRDTIASINNLAKLYRASGRAELAERYEAAIARFNDSNPYYHFARGNLALTQEDYTAARVSFRRAIRLKQEEPDFFIALAQANMALGYEERARQLKAVADALLSSHTGIFQPSEDKLRIIDRSTILRDTDPGITIQVN